MPGKAATFSRCRVFPVNLILASCGARYCGLKNFHRFSAVSKDHKSLNARRAWLEIASG